MRLPIHRESDKAMKDGKGKAYEGHEERVFRMVQRG